MSRALISERFDDLVADHAISRADALAHYRKRPDSPMLGGVRVFLSAGAHGEPVPLLYDEQAWQSYVRTIHQALDAAGAPPDGVVALVGTDDPAHTLCRLQELAPPGMAVAIGLQDGVEQACERLEELQPDVLFGIASAIALIAECHPRISPAAVLTSTDALDEPGRSAIQCAFGVDPLVSYGLTEAGLVAAQCRSGGDMHVFEDAVLVEAVGDAVYVTNLVNRIQPMIRLRLPEQVTSSSNSCACGGSLARLRLNGGRMTSIWRVPALRGGTAALHPIVLRSALDPLVLRKLPRVQWTGQTLRVFTTEKVEHASSRLYAALQRAGADPRILAVALDSESPPAA